ncbi:MULTISPECIES: TonB system transport protein ExbD [Oligella]|uniref:Biopolymer transport protein ExbD n=2 Tax=Oligella urethralis TaxID=90245 RepID=A0A095Z973_9BURK|nr:MULTISPECIES: TonB system transport protein ExbD [Oligella]AVL70214.1 TonB system transport protein ExbD [Oligella urethralis]KGF30896.1 biopolymer transporter ExbD [Oligella urethralis DNF00040]MDK6202927.1 TonB system transport protein ExbD [Oligella urethralis]OFV51143.1 TonB system transport protein ExbD [Oligella sp. HMSC09E12]PMC17627.1 TonB system transport protein ExbD [Oligella urethralis]
MQKFDGINVVPFIDIMLVLLAIVLATATFISQGKIQVNLPQSNNSTSLASQDLAVVVVVDQAGHYFIDDKPQSLSELEALMTQQSDQPITIKVDATAPFQSFLSLTDILNKQNLSKVTVITEKSSTEQH